MLSASCRSGDVLENGERHDGRAPDYDDWSLNADIVVYYPVLDIALELSSMGIRVDKDALLTQLEKAGCPERAELPFQKAIIEEKLPYTIGGGIGPVPYHWYVLFKKSPYWRKYRVRCGRKKLYRKPLHTKFLYYRQRKRYIS